MGTSQNGVSFDTEVNIDLRAMQKGQWTIDDVPVKVEAFGGFEDNRFDWEAGDQHGTHDPGSGYATEQVKIISSADLMMHDAQGNEMPGQLLLKAGQEIPETFIEKTSLERLYALADKQLETGAQHEPDADDGPIGG